MLARASRLPPGRQRRFRETAACTRHTREGESFSRRGPASVPEETEGRIPAHSRAAKAHHHHCERSDCRCKSATNKGIEAEGDRRWRSDASEAPWPGYSHVRGYQGSCQCNHGGDPPANPGEMSCGGYPHDDKKHEDKLPTATGTRNETFREGRRRGAAQQAVSPGDRNKRQECRPTHHRDRAQTDRRWDDGGPRRSSTHPCIIASRLRRTNRRSQDVTTLGMSTVFAYDSAAGRAHFRAGHARG